MSVYRYAGGRGTERLHTSIAEYIPSLFLTRHLLKGTVQENSFRKQGNNEWSLQLFNYPLVQSAHATSVVPHHAQLQQYSISPTLFTLALALVTHGKSFQSEISSAFRFYARELNLVSNVGK